MTEPRTRKDAEVLMLRAEVEKVSAERDAMRTALSSVRKAAGSGRDMTNRLQFIYARSGAAIDGLPWDDSWKAEHGYTMRDRTLRENDLLRQEVERLRADAERIDAIQAWLDQSKANGFAWNTLCFSTTRTARESLDRRRAALGADHAD